MPYQMLPPGKYICQLTKPAEGSTTIRVAEFADRDGNGLGGLVCNMIVDVFDEAGNYLRTAYCENWRGVTLAMRKATAEYPDGLLPFNWDKLVQIFGLRSRAEVLELERLAGDPTRGPAIMATRFELHCEHQTYSAKDAHGMPTGELKTAERYTFQPLGYVPGSGGFRGRAEGQTATLNRFRTLIMASKAPVTTVQVDAAKATASPAAPQAPTPATATPPSAPAMPARRPAAQPAPAAAPVDEIDAANQAHAILPEVLWRKCSERWGAQAEDKLFKAMDLVKSATGKNLDELTPAEAFVVGTNLDIGLLPF